MERVSKTSRYLSVSKFAAKHQRWRFLLRLLTLNRNGIFPGLLTAHFKKFNKNDRGFQELRFKMFPGPGFLIIITDKGGFQRTLFYVVLVLVLVLVFGKVCLRFDNSSGRTQHQALLPNADIHHLPCRSILCRGRYVLSSLLV